jgi:putative transposase
MSDEPELPGDEHSLMGTRDWPHAPPHRLMDAGVYFVTARTRDGVHLLDTPAKRDVFQTTLFELATKYGWRLEAWAILSNHYHLVAHSPPTRDGAAGNLSDFLRHLHSAATREINRLDGAPGGSRLWQNFRETHLTLQRGYLARLNYVHQNPVHHKLVPLASQWPWCSAAEFKQAVSPAWLKTIMSFRFDQIAKADGE